MEPARVMVIGFGILILFGAIILIYNFNSRWKYRILNALFTSFCVCVTGLVVVDTEDIGVNLANL